MLSMVELLLIKGEVGVYALNSHGKYIVDHGKSWKNHAIVLLNFWGNPVALCKLMDSLIRFDMISLGWT